MIGEVPEPLPPFGQKHLEEFLAVNIPCVDKNTLTATMKQDLKDAETEMIQMVKDNDVNPRAILVFPLDRASGKTYARRYSINICPTLTCANRYLFVASMDFAKPPEERKLWTFLHPSERMVLQGFNKDTLAGTSGSLRVQASANAYPVPLLMAILRPILQKLKGVKFNAGGSFKDERVTALLGKFDKYMEDCANEATDVKGPKNPKKRPATPKKSVKKGEGKTKAVKDKKGKAGKWKKAKVQSVMNAAKRVRKHQCAKKLAYRFLSSSSS